MQTFLPYSDYQQSAKCLDMKRLGKQRVEVLQLLNSFYRPDYKGWKNHPAREMWRGYENALVRYGQFICLEWISRGYKDTCYQKISDHFNVSKHTQDPPWIGREDIHISHKSNLIRKMPGYYKPLWPEVPDDIAYVWQLIKYGMEIVAALKLPDGTIFIGRFSHAKAMYALLKDIPNPSQELLDNIVEGFIDMKTNKFYTRDEFKVIHSSYSYNLTSQNIV